jgi:hypothetical protein
VREEWKSENRRGEWRKLKTEDEGMRTKERDYRFDIGGVKIED